MFSWARARLTSPNANELAAWEDTLLLLCDRWKLGILNCLCYYPYYFLPFCYPYISLYEGLLNSNAKYHIAGKHGGIKFGGLAIWLAEQKIQIDHVTMWHLVNTLCLRLFLQVPSLTRPSLGMPDALHFHQLAEIRSLHDTTHVRLQWDCKILLEFNLAVCSLSAKPWN